MDTTTFSANELSKFIYYQDLQSIEDTDVLYHTKNAFLTLHK